MVQDGDPLTAASSTTVQIPEDIITISDLDSETCLQVSHLLQMGNDKSEMINSESEKTTEMNTAKEGQEQDSIHLDGSVSSFPTHSSNRKSISDVNLDMEECKRLNLLVAGGSGSGKTTFGISALKGYCPSCNIIEPPTGPTAQITERVRCEKQQGSTRVIITIVDTRGYGDSMNNEDRISPVLDYVEMQNRKYEDNEEYRRPSNQENDTRIHCCFYFFMPHRVTPVDVEFMKRLGSKVALVPVLAKTDTLTTDELEQQLYSIHREIKENGIEIFDFKEDGIDESWLQDFANTKQVQEGLTHDSTDGSPAAAAADVVPSGSQRRARKIRNIFAVISGFRDYPWGQAREDLEEHSDTPRLRRVLFQQGALGRLQIATNAIHERWRSDKKERSSPAYEPVRALKDQLLLALNERNYSIVILLVVGFLFIFLSIAFLLFSGAGKATRHPILPLETLYQILQ